MTSEIRANTLKNRVGLGTVSYTNTGIIVSGIVTANSFSGPYNGTDIVGTGLTLTSTDAGSAAGPELKLFRNSASPADADYLGQIKFAAESDTGVERNYAKITGKILDASNGTEDGILEFAHIKAGSQTITGRWRSDSLQLLNDTNLSVAGDTTLTGDIDVDGHTNLDNVSIAGVTTITGSGNALEIVGGLVRSRNTASARFVANNGSAEGYFGWSSGVLTVGQAAATLSLEATGSNHIQLKTNGSERLRIDSNGRVVIGHSQASTNYGKLLHIHNSASAGASLHLTDSTTGTSNSDGFEIVTHSQAAYLVQRENSHMIFMTNGTNERLRIANNGVLLCGTTAAASSLRAVFQGYSDGGENFQARIRFQSAQATNLTTNSHIANLLFTNASGSEGARIDVKADSNWGTGSYPSRIEFSTTASGANSTTERLRITSGGNVRHLGSNNRMYTFSTDDSAHYLKYNTTVNGLILNGYGNITFETNGQNERVRIDSDGRLLVGQTSAIQGIYGSPPPRFSVSTTTASPAIFATYSNNTYGSRIDLLKSRATSVGTHTVLQANDVIGELYFGGSDGDQYQPGALIQSVVHTGVGDNDMPTDIRFWTNPGNTQIYERMRIQPNGYVGIMETDPQYPLHVKGATTTSAPTGTGILMGLQHDHALIHLNAAADKGSIIDFSVPGVDRRGGILYYHSNNPTVANRDKMQFTVNGSTTGMEIHSSGNITKPNHCAFKSNATGQYGGVGSLTTTVANVGILQAGEQYDRGDNYSTSTYLFTCPVDGIYLVNVTVSVSNIGNNRHIFIIAYTNGGGSTPLQNYFECIDGNTSNYANYSYCEPWYFTAGTTIGVGKNGHSGYNNAYTMQWGVHLLG